MTVEGFLKNNTKINDGDNLPDDMLISTYENLKSRELSTPNRGIFLNDFNESTFLF